MSSAACRGGDTCYLGTFGLVPNTTAEVTLSIEAYAPTADPPVVCPVMVELATGNMATADVNENGQADDCFVGDYDAPLTLPMPTHPTAPYGWYGAYVTFPTDAPDYEGPADQGGIWGYWWFNVDANGHFLHIWPFWSAGARQTAAAVVPGSQGQGAARTEPRLHANIPPRLFAHLLPVETQHAASPHAASPPPRPPQPATIIHTPPVLEDTATIAYTRQRATLTLAGMTIAIHITDTSAPDELIYVFADHLGSASILADDSGTAIPGSTARYLPLRQAQGRLFGDWRTEPTADETSRWYTGHVHDNLSHNDLGLIYMNARFYLPGIGRFVSADTIVPNPSDPQSFNRYSYGLNNPLKYIDPTGHSPVCDMMPEECQDSTPGLVSFDMAAGVDEIWNAAEKGAIYRGAYDLGSAFARDINARGRAMDLSRFGEGEYQDITPETAFLTVFGGPVTFRKTGQSCAEATGAASCYAETQSSRLIHVFTDIYDDRGQSRIPGTNTSGRWAVHELGHAFESRVNGRVGTWGHIRSQLPDNVLNRNGFAGGFPGWQQSREDTRGEIFADMFVGWTYNRWETDRLGTLTDAAELKANYMTTNMATWIRIASP